MSYRVAGPGTKSWVDEETRYLPKCGGCGNEYGDPHTSLEAAYDFVIEHPRCSSCNPEVTP